MTPLERFHAKWMPEPNTGCWLWLGALTAGGYGCFYVDKHYRSTAHRVSYELFVGPIPAGLQIDHLCRVRGCVNPDHLEPVTCRENLMRGPTTLNALNVAKTHCPKGHPLSGGNLKTNRHGHRDCGECRRVLRRRRYLKERRQEKR